MDWLKNLFGGGSKEDQTQEAATSAPEQSGSEQGVSSEGQGEATPESGGEEQPPQQ